MTVARSKTDSIWLPQDREALQYLTGLGLHGCSGCLKVRRVDLFNEAEGECFYCTGEMTPELEARVENDKLLLKKLRAKLKRLNAKKKPALIRLKPQVDEEDSPEERSDTI